MSLVASLLYIALALNIAGILASRRSIRRAKHAIMGAEQAEREYDNAIAEFENLTALLKTATDPETRMTDLKGIFDAINQATDDALARKVEPS